jgi:hypothetical protein
VEEKTLKEMSDRELDTVINGLKFASFTKWLKEGKRNKEANRKLAIEIEQRTGLKRGSLENYMCLSFFAGMDAGAEKLEVVKTEKG